MSIDIDLFAPREVDDIRHPRFSLVRKGYDPYDVLEYVSQVADRVEALERELEVAREERDATRRFRESAKEAAYGELADRMAEVLRTAEHEADRIRREAAAESRQKLADAEQRAEDIERDAASGAERMRAEAGEVLRRAKEEADRVLGGLRERREEIISDLHATRTRLMAVVEQLDLTTAIAEAQSPSTEVAGAEPLAEDHSDPPAPVADVDSNHVVVRLSDISSEPEEPGTEGSPQARASSPGPGEEESEDDTRHLQERVTDPQVVDLLTTTEGFDLVIPEMFDEEPEGSKPEGSKPERSEHGGRSETDS
jgi:cell division septum initiation protein DivIVA